MKGGAYNAGYVRADAWNRPAVKAVFGKGAALAVVALADPVAAHAVGRGPDAKAAFG